MSVKLGSGDVSFRLGSATPSKVAIGSTEVWTDVVPTVPGIPTGLAVTADGDNQSSVDVSWSVPASDGDSPITGYRVYRSLDGSTYTLHSSPSGTSATVTVANNGGQTIYIKVAAVNAIGEGSQSEVTTGALSDGAPGVIDYVQLIVNGPLTLSLQWSPPAVDGGEDITGYIISYTKTTGGSTVYTETVGNAVTDYTFDGSEESVGVSYNANVAAINAIGTGPSSASVSVSTADVPGTPSWMSASSSSSSGGIDIGFTPAFLDGGSPVTQYELEYDTGEYFSTAFSETISAGETSYTLTGLQGGQGYYLRLRAANAAGNGEWAVYGSIPVTASATVPGVPASLSVSPDYENEEWDASWIEPSDGGSTITQYEIEETDADFLSATTETKYGTGSSHSWSVAVADQLRYFRIRAVNAVGAGEWTAWTSGSTYDTPDPPAAPTGLTGFNGAALYWTAPASDGGSPITSYRVYADSTDVSSSGTFVTPSTIGGDVEWVSNVSGTYEWTVVAVNAVGDGAASNAITYEMV